MSSELEKTIVSKGNGHDYPQPGDIVIIEYTGNLYDQSKGRDNFYRGKQ